MPRLDERALLLDDERSRPGRGRSRATIARLERPEHAELAAGGCRRARRRRRGRACAAPRAGRSRRCRRRRCRARRRARRAVIAVEAVQAGVRAGELAGAGRCSVRSISSDCGREQAAVGLRGRTGRPRTRRSASTGRTRSRPTLRGADGVGDVGGDLQRRPTGRTRATAATAWRPRSRTSCTLPGKIDRHAEARRACASRGGRQRGGLAGRVVAAQGDEAALRVGADEVAVAQRVGRAVDARAPCRTRRRRTPSTVGLREARARAG